MKRIADTLLESPGLKTICSVVIPIAASVLSAVFIVQISNPDGLEWDKAFKAWAFYGLIVLSIVMYIYNRAIYLYEREVHRFLDSDYCIAYMRSKCLPEAADRYRKLIRSGEGGELQKAMDELQRILK